MAYKRYPEEFMNQAVQLCLAEDANRKEIADNLGINYKTLCTWITRYMSKSTPQDKKIDYKTQYQKLISENAELKKKLKKAETEREILKKASAYFANPNM
ncbi:transposase [Francisella sp. TX07-6608]|uniref:transposase n=1 Tax=Francisella sp. TX07-6608 TaxID=573568 RepID=UPI0008F9CE12|nr:transposase [Francisella sp. TX07-6608]OIN83701.1 transposase family protein [Francisella sp. TX07-6608]OIN83921.1 transposase family protein [Francisella sp. TX07-6608]OIN84309.1 transposase family protein [Francisella sp. TX07-6608]OIN84689.1 transposase family protein [Francisella sp. TX07-6608]